MRHLKNQIAPLRKQEVEGLVFHIDPNYQDDLTALIQRFITQPEQHAVLDIPELTRGVYLLEGERKWVLKYNKLVHWKK